SLIALIFAQAADTTTAITSSSDEKLACVKATCGTDHTVKYKTTP
ncbi:hypothetical protein G647_01377, partial [Cladophialophora carrionii CBS 160.54]